MTWKEFERERGHYKSAWESVKASYAGKMREYLGLSKVVVFAGREFDIDADLNLAFSECPAFFILDAKENLSEETTIAENWQVQLRFPFVDIDFIQELKASPQCDKSRTLMKPSSTEVVLLPRKD